jgi:hypothetical protein
MIYSVYERCGNSKYIISDVLCHANNFLSGVIYIPLYNLIFHLSVYYQSLGVSTWRKTRGDGHTHRVKKRRQVTWSSLLFSMTTGLPVEKINAVYYKVDPFLWSE